MILCLVKNLITIKINKVKKKKKKYTYIWSKIDMTDLLNVHYWHNQHLLMDKKHKKSIEYKTKTKNNLSVISFFLIIISF